MKLEDIACQILVNAGKYKSQDEALKALRSEYNLHFPKSNFEEWNRDLPESTARNVISNVGKNGSMSVRFLIKDLETICQQL
jgi:hypothetical protein